MKDLSSSFSVMKGHEILDANAFITVLVLSHLVLVSKYAALHSANKCLLRAGRELRLAVSTSLALLFTFVLNGFSTLSCVTDLKCI